MSEISVTCPFDQEEIGKVTLMSEAEALAALDKASELFNDKEKWLKHYERIAILKKLTKLVAEQSDDFAHLIASEGGKPLIDAKVEVARAIDGIEIAIKSLMHVYSGTEIPMGFTAATDKRRAFTIKEPVGIVLAISAFNHPLNLIVHQIVPAIATGCPVIVKPATSTPLNCLKLCELVNQAGLPSGWCQPVICDNKVASRLVSDKRLGFFSFIGSGRVGWMLKNQLAPGVRCALEHGGVAPVIIDQGVDIDRVVAPLLKGGFYHAGQVCVSVQRIYVPADNAEQLADKLAAGAKQLKIGDARLADTEVGSLITLDEVDRVAKWVDDAVEKGGKLVCGGKKLGESCYEATIVLNPPEDCILSQNEVFGPVVSIYSYDSLDEAVKRANGLDFAFQAAVFTDNIKNSQKLAEDLHATAVMINDHTAFRADWMPFGGYKESGYSLGGILDSMEDMVRSKMIVQNYS